MRTEEGWLEEEEPVENLFIVKSDRRRDAHLLAGYLLRIISIINNVISIIISTVHCACAVWEWLRVV